jgi:exopolysaccharide biosynthesis polyprenyl glycosylphosphotransferase
MTVSEVGTSAGYGAVAGVGDPPLAPGRGVLDDASRRVRRFAEAGSRTAAMHRALVLADATAVVAGLGLAIIFGSPDERGLAQLPWCLAYPPAILFLFKLYGLYDGDRKRLGHSTLDDISGVFHAAVMAALGIWALLKLGPAERLVLAQAALLVVLTIGLVLAARAGARRIVARLAAPERILLLGAGPSAELLMRKVRAHDPRGLQPVGYLSAPSDKHLPPEPELPWLGQPGDLGRVTRAFGVERVMIASPALEPQELTDLVREATCANLKITLLPSAIEVLGPSTEVDDVRGLTVLGVNPAQFSRSSQLLKRTLDVSLSAAALVMLLPVLPLVALAIKVDSPGPVFFRQKRLGRGGSIFQLIKFRTMVEDAEAQVTALQASSAEKAWLKLDRDPRVTAVGRFLRATSIDELPQLWNVLRGEMSLVGPRPMPLITGRYITGWGMRRHDLTPGLTGMWQVLGRSAVPFEEMIKLDYLYVTNWSIWRDVRLLIRTFSVVLCRRGAN